MRPRDPKPPFDGHSRHSRDGKPIHSWMLAGKSLNIVDYVSRLPGHSTAYISRECTECSLSQSAPISDLDGLPVAVQHLRDINWR